MSVRRKQALQGRRMDAFGMSPNELTIVGIDTDHDSSHPLWDDRINLPVDERLIRNISVYGVLQPVIVTKMEDLVVVVDGRQRVRAARVIAEQQRRAGEEQIRVPCLVKSGDGSRLVGVGISANEQRQMDTAATKARKAARYLDLGRTEEEAALAFGVSEQTIRNWLAVTTLEPEVQIAIEAGRISATEAVSRCAGRKREVQLRCLEQPKRVKLGRPKGPSKAKLAQVLESEHLDGLHPEFVRALRFVLGEVDAAEVGLGEVFAPKSSKGRPHGVPNGARCTHCHGRAKIVGDDEGEFFCSRECMEAYDDEHNKGLQRAV